MALDANMKTILKAVSSALQLDGSNNKKAAYVSYLQCIQQVAHVLLQDANIPGFSVSASTKKCVQLGQQCMERILELVDTLQPDRNVCLTVQSVGNSQSSFRSPKTSTSSENSVGTSGDTSRVSDLSPQQCQLPELPSPAQSFKHYVRSSSEPSPMEIAQRKNQQLMQAYKKRMASISAKSQSATNISLSLQRRMAENMAIARGRQEALAKKLQERQRRLEEEAARRFASTAGMSKDEQERRRIYSQVLIYEADSKYWQAWREKLSTSPDDGNLVQDLILRIINTKDHPLTQLLNKLQYSIYDKLRPLVLSYIHELNRISVPYIQSPEREQVKELSPEAKDRDSNLVRSQSTEASNRVVDHGKDVSSGSETSSPNQENNSSSAQNSFVEVCEQNKNDLEVALNQNSQLSQQLKDEARCSAVIVKNISDIDQFDDLYEDKVDELGVTSGSDESAEVGFDTTDMDMVKDLASVTDEEKIENLKKDALDKHMTFITSDVREGMDKLSAMFIVAYEALDSAAGRDLCWSSLEEPFFRPLWPYLLALYRLGNYDKEVLAAKAMTRLIDVSPADLGIKNRFCPKVGVQPFQSCIDELTRLTKLTSPLAKLESIVRLCKLLCQTMEENSNSGSAQQTTGADDLLPVLSYVVIHCSHPQIVAECHAMEEFIHEGYLMGEEGYCLTSLQTSLSYVISMADPTSSPPGDSK